MTEDQREQGIYEPYQGKLSDTRVVPLQCAKKGKEKAVYPTEGKA